MQSERVRETDISIEKGNDCGSDGAEPEIRNPSVSIVASPIILDGGILAWTQVLVGFLLMFSSWGLINSFGVFQEYYSTAPALETTGTIAWIGSVQSCLTLVLGAFSGRLVDAGYARPMTVLGSFFIVFGLVCTSLSGGSGMAATGKPALVYYQILLSQGVCCGVGMGLVFIPSVGITATYFQKRRALAVGIVSAGAAVGGVVYPVVFEALLVRLDFRWVVRALALVAFVTLGIACALVRARTDLPKKKKAPMIALGAFKEPKYLALAVGMFASFTGVYVVYFYVESKAKAAHINFKGLEPHYLVSFLNVGGVFGRTVPNYVADRTNPVLVHGACICITGILVFIWPFITNLAGTVIFCLIYGFFSGAFASLVPSSVAGTTVDMSTFGARLGMAVTCNGFGVLIGMPIAGAVIRSGGNMNYVFAAVFAGLITTTGGLLLGLAGILRRGRFNMLPKWCKSKVTSDCMQ